MAKYKKPIRGRVFSSYEERNEVIKHQYLSGRRIGDIAQEMGIVPSAVSKVIARMNLTCRNLRADLPAQQVVSFYLNEGMTCLQIAEHFGCGPEKVKNVLRKHGVDIRKPVPPSGSSSLGSRWRGLLKAGMSAAEIARKESVDEETVRVLTEK